MSIFVEAKIDCHLHLLDPTQFPYAPQAWYQPVEAEQSNAAYLASLLDSYGVQHALVVGPNSGYDTDNCCLLDLLDTGQGRYRGVAVVDLDTTTAQLVALQRAGVVGVTMQVALLGVDHFRGSVPLLDKLAQLGMFVDIQTQGDQLLDMAPLLDAAGGPVLIDHCGRPDPGRGLGQPGFQLLCDLGASGRYTVKLSGMVKASRQGFPYRDAWPFVERLLDAFTPDRCLWGSDWPFLRAPERMDYGPLLSLVNALIPDPDDRRKVLWDTPSRLFGFGDQITTSGR